MNATYQGLHVRIAARKLLRVEIQIAVIVLPAIVQRDPGESHLLDRRQRVVHLLKFYRPSITPRTPDRPKSTVRRRSHLKSLPRHEAAIFGERTKVIPLMHRDKSAKSMESVARIERSFMTTANAHTSLTRVGH